MTVRETQDGMIRELTAEEGRALLDLAARRELGISGEEFLRRYHAGEYADADTPEVTRVAMLVHLADE